MSTLEVVGNVLIECPVCGHEHNYCITYFVEKFGFDMSLWIDNKWAMACEKCEYSIELDGLDILKQERE